MFPTNEVSDIVGYRNASMETMWVALAGRLEYPLLGIASDFRNEYLHLQKVINTANPQLPPDEKITISRVPCGSNNRSKTRF